MPKMIVIKTSVRLKAFETDAVVVTVERSVATKVE
jgi:hypothetical protein